MDKAIFKTINSGQFILGENLENLENKIAKLVGVRYAVGVNSGTDALFLSMKALGIKKGDEVITTPFTFISTAEVIANCGAKPVFVDIDPQTYNIDPSKIERAITQKTKAIIPVHLYGQMADMASILKIAKRHRLKVVEDAAQAIGSKQKIKKRGGLAGSLGNLNCFSFFPTKNLGAYGDAGMVTTNNKQLAEKLISMRNHGSKRKYYYDFLGYSTRLDELQAAILLAKIPHIKSWNKKRREIATFYNKNLSQIAGLTVPQITRDNYHVFHQYTIRTKRRDELSRYLKKEGIPTTTYYPEPLHLQPAFKYLGYRKNAFPESERASREVISLPLYPELKGQDQIKVMDAIKSFFK